MHSIEHHGKKKIHSRVGGAWKTRGREGGSPMQQVGLEEKVMEEQRLGGGQLAMQMSRGRILQAEVIALRQEWT